jgi:hypothetical protein
LRFRWFSVFVISVTALQGQTLQGQPGAIQRGMDFIISVARNPAYFADYGDDLLWCFYSISATSGDPGLSKIAGSVGRERALAWRRLHPTLPPDANAGTIAEMAFGSYAAEKLGVPDPRLKEQIRAAAPRFPVRDYLKFDPAHEPPPDYDTWCDALVTSYTGDRFGVTLGAPWAAVIKWLPQMRPYDVRKDPLYAITHLVYTMNDYSLRQLDPECLKPEFEFLKSNFQNALQEGDPEPLGEYIDTLKSFGLRDDDPLIRKGVRFLLAAQNPDGSWGDPKDRDIYNRYHATWTAIDGLRDYRFSSRRPSGCRPL